MKKHNITKVQRSLVFTLLLVITAGSAFALVTPSSVTTNNVNATTALYSPVLNSWDLKTDETISSTVLIDTDDFFTGAYKGSKLTAINSLNSNVLESNGRVNSFYIENIQIDGNKASQTSGNCIYVNGFYNVFKDIWATDCKENGLFLNVSASSSESKILGGRYNGDSSGIKTSENNNDMLISTVTTTGGEYGFDIGGSGFMAGDIWSYDSTNAAFKTNVAGMVRDARMSSTPIAFKVDSTNNNVFGVWQGLTVSDLVTSSITDHLVEVNTTSGNSALVNLIDVVGESNNEEISLHGNGTVRLKASSAYAILDIAKEASVNIHDESYVLQPPIPQSIVPSEVKGNIYLDDGTNTQHGNIGWRRYTGSEWEDLGNDLVSLSGSETYINSNDVNINGSLAPRLTIQYTNSNDGRLVFSPGGTDQWVLHQDNFLSGDPVDTSDLMRMTVDDSTGLDAQRWYTNGASYFTNPTGVYFTSPNGSVYLCGPNNAGTWGCS
jgi:hypothetical protein